MDYKQFALEIADSDSCYEDMLIACLNYMSPEDIKEMLRYNEYYYEQPTHYEHESTVL